MGNSCSPGPPLKNKHSDTITFEHIAKFPRRAEIGCQGVPTMISFSPDNKDIVFLWNKKGGLTQSLYRMEIATKTITILFDAEKGDEKKKYTEEEKLRRERLRMLAKGVTSYSWRPGNSGDILLPLNGNLYILRGASGKPELIVDSKTLPSSLMDARFSANGKQIAFVCDSEVWMISAEGSGRKPVMVTFGAKRHGLTNGIADYVAQEEMSRYEGFWLSPNGKFVAFEQVDENHIPKYRIMHQGSDKVGKEAEEDHAYPFAGAANPKVKLGIVSHSGSRAEKWLELEESFGADFYLTNVRWLNDKELVYMVQNRDQTELDVHLYSFHEKKSKLLFKETESKYWINLHQVLLPLGGKSFIWASERTGYTHLYKIDEDGACTPLTKGKWVVDACNSSFVDVNRGHVYFLASKDSCKERHLYRANLDKPDPDNIVKITEGRGYHSVVMASDFSSYVDSYSNVDETPKIQIKPLNGGGGGDKEEKIKKQKIVHFDVKVPTGLLAKMNLVTPIFEEVKVRAECKDGDGHKEVALQTARYIPRKDVFGEGPYPTIVSVYGGPHYQGVVDKWSLTADLRTQHFVQNGFMVLKIDNRGSARRGLEFEGALKWKMGTVEVEDQTNVVQHFIKKGLVHKEKIGIYGWSYGGYMTLMCMAQKPEVFKAGVSGAPVTHWDGYDTHYTERYMGTPQSNPKGYKIGSVMEHVENLDGDLLLVHGLIDENVHFRHTARLINALIHARKDYRLLLFPDERHQPRKHQDLIYMEEKIFAHFHSALKVEK